MSILRPNRRKDRNKDPRGLLFMGWVKGLPCVVCFTLRFTLDMFWEMASGPNSGHSPNISGSMTEFAHVDGNAAAKSSNLHGLPLCGLHHREGPMCQERLKRAFGEYWSIDVHAIIARLVAEFDRIHAE